MQAKRIKWKELKLAIEHWKLVFLDESGVNIGMTRRYGRAIGKARVHGSAPLNVPTSQTVLASVRLNGQITYTMYPGGTTGERFLDYLKNFRFTGDISGYAEGDLIMFSCRLQKLAAINSVIRLRLMNDNTQLTEINLTAGQRILSGVVAGFAVVPANTTGIVVQMSALPGAEIKVAQVGVFNLTTLDAI